MYVLYYCVPQCLCSGRHDVTYCIVHHCSFKCLRSTGDSCYGTYVRFWQISTDSCIQSHVKRTHDFPGAVTRPAHESYPKQPPGITKNFRQRDVAAFVEAYYNIFLQPPLSTYKSCRIQTCIHFSVQCKVESGWFFLWQCVFFIHVHMMVMHCLY